MKITTGTSELRDITKMERIGTVDMQNFVKTTI
jgi:hypothetical protein